MPVIFILAGAGSIGFLTLFFIELQRDGMRGSRVEITRLEAPIEEKLSAQRSASSSQAGEEEGTKTENTVAIDWWKKRATAEARTLRLAR